MTLVVSVRVPDGIVIAADSLATLQAQGQTSASIEISCPNCQHKHTVDVDVPIPTEFGTVSTMPFAQKVIPLFGRFGIGAFGSSLIGEVSVFSLIRAFERENNSDADKLEPIATAENLATYLQDKLRGIVDLDKTPDNSYALGFQLIGYDSSGVQHTVAMQIGKDIKLEDFSAHGTSVNGDIVIVQQLWDLSKDDPRFGSLYTAWSVQHAADYARFLISTTADLQRFTATIPKVGGDIDVGLVTPEGRYSWVDRKPLTDLLMAGPDRKEISSDEK